MDLSRPNDRRKTSPRRRPLFRIEAEALEGRQLLTGGAGNTFALTQGTIATAGGTSVQSFTIDSSHFTPSHGRIVIGVDVVAGTGSTVVPTISGIKGARVRMTGVSPDGKHDIFATVSLPAKNGKVTGSVTIKAQNNTSGSYLLGYYLPGDADGDGTVTKADVTTIKSLIGQTVNDASYNFDADTNRDGQITKADLVLAKENLGAKTSIMPDFTASLDPNTDTGAADRITNDSTVNFTGQAAPGAAITFHEVLNQVPDIKATADSSGNYKITTPLALGTNTFQVSAADAFGQTIQGSIQPVTYTTGPVPTATSTSSTSTA